MRRAVFRTCMDHFLKDSLAPPFEGRAIEAFREHCVEEMRAAGFDLNREILPVRLGERQCHPLAGAAGIHRPPFGQPELKRHRPAQEEAAGSEDQRDVPKDSGLSEQAGQPGTPHGHDQDGHIDPPVEPAELPDRLEGSPHAPGDGAPDSGLAALEG